MVIPGYQTVGGLKYPVYAVGQPKRWALDCGATSTPWGCVSVCDYECCFSVDLVDGNPKPTLPYSDHTAGLQWVQKPQYTLGEGITLNANQQAAFDRLNALLAAHQISTQPNAVSNNATGRVWEHVVDYGYSNIQYQCPDASTDHKWNLGAAWYFNVPALGADKYAAVNFGFENHLGDTTEGDWQGCCGAYEQARWSSMSITVYSDYGATVLEESVIFDAICAYELRVVNNYCCTSGSSCQEMDGQTCTGSASTGACAEALARLDPIGRELLARQLGGCKGCGDPGVTLV